MPNIKIKHKDGSIETIPFPDSMNKEQIKESILSKYGASKEEKSPESNWKDTFSSALKRGAADIGVGASELMRNTMNTPNNLLWNGFPKQEQPNYQAAFGAPREDEKNLADKFLQFAPELAGAMSLPATRLGSVGKTLESIPKAGKYLKTALGNALSQGTYAATQSPENSLQSGLTAGSVAAPFSALAQGAMEGSPVTRFISKGLLGLGAGGAGFGIAKGSGAGNLPAGAAGLLAGILAAKHGVNPMRMAEKKMVKGIEGTDYIQALEAQNRLGLTHLTPAEASGSPFAGAAQGSVGKTEPGSALMFEKGKERTASEKDAIDKFMNTIFNPKKDAKTRESLYEAIKPNLVPEKKLERFKENEIFKDAEKNILKNPSYRQELKGVSDNSIEYLDLIKRHMGDAIETAKRAGNKTEANLIGKTQKDLVKTIDDIAPDYQKARAIAERGIARNKLEDYFKKKERSMTGSNFAKFIGNEKNYEKLQYNLRNVPEAQNQLADMKLIFHRLINIPTGKASEAQARTSMSKSRASSDAAMRELKEILTAGKFDKKAVELMTNPKWADELKRLNGISGTEKFLGSTYNIFSKVGAQTTAKQE